MLLVRILTPVLFAIGIVIIFQTFLKRSSRNYEKQKEKFLKEEQEASYSRSNEIEEQRYIKPSILDLKVIDVLDVKTEPDTEVYNIQSDILKLATKPMLHLKESNLELKKMYGVANLEYIIQCEENYNTFLSKLNSFAESLIKLQKTEEAIKILEEAIKLGTDYSKSFKLLADLYNKKNDKASLRRLAEISHNTKNIAMTKTTAYIEELLKS